MTAPVMNMSDAVVGAPVSARSPIQLALGRLMKDRVAVVSFVVIVLAVLVAVAAPLTTVLTGHDPHMQYREQGLDSFGTPTGPGSTFWLGADQIGRDLFVRLAYGARISLFVGAVATVCSIGIGTLIGLVAGFRRGKVDVVLNWLMDTTLCLPQLLFAISLVSLAGPGLGITVAVIVLFTWAPIARVVRGQVLSLREREFVEAATSLGARSSRIMAVDVLPNLLVPIVIYGTLLVPQAIVFEATLSFLGLGVLPPTATWGNMLAAASAGSLYTVAWWMVLFPSMALLALTLAFNLLGDSVRDALDPRHSFHTERAKKARRKRAALQDLEDEGDVVAQ